MAEYIFAFLVGGAITVAITYFEASGWSLVSRLAALFPIFTWLSIFSSGKLPARKLFQGMLSLCFWELLLPGCHICL
jgi:hypothetical protein